MLDRKQGRSNHRRHFARIGQLPAHQHHQAKTKEEKNESADSVLNSDHFVVGRKYVFPPETELGVLVFGVVGVRVVMRLESGRSVHSKKKLASQYSEGKSHCKV